MKGQRARSGDRPKMSGFEGGQVPLYRRIPKRGFNSKFRTEYAVINVDVLDKNFTAGKEVTISQMREMGLVKRDLPIKILGTGDIKKALTVKANAFSASAIEKIKNAGGSAETVK
jgi:large subunit ribosomal protein L15